MSQDRDSLCHAAGCRRRCIIGLFDRQHILVYSVGMCAVYHRPSVRIAPVKRRRHMKIVVVKAPSLLNGILKLLFRIK